MTDTEPQVGTRDALYHGLCRYCDWESPDGYATPEAARQASDDHETECDERHDPESCDDRTCCDDSAETYIVWVETSVEFRVNAHSQAQADRMVEDLSYGVFVTQEPDDVAAWTDNGVEWTAVSEAERRAQEFEFRRAVAEAEAAIDHPEEKL